MTPETPPIPDPLFTPASPLPVSAPSLGASAVARWRWWVALLIIGSNPILASILSASRASKGGKSGAVMQLPRTVPELLFFCALQLAIYGVFFGVFWLFSRANRDQLFLRWRDGFKVALWGFLYSLAMRFGIRLLVFVVLVVVAVVLSLMGVKLEALEAIIKANSGGGERVFLPAMQHGSVAYRVLMVLLISFVVAGLREELWRAATMACLFSLAPKKWGRAAQNALVLGVSSTIFGLGHLYQGWIGVGVTACLGVVLGAITLRHRSIWPAVWAHGFFDAASFVMLALIVKK